MSNTPEGRLCEQEALAVVRALMEDRESDAVVMIQGSDSPAALAFVAAGLAAAALRHGGIDGGLWLRLRQRELAASEL